MFIKSIILASYLLMPNTVQIADCNVQSCDITQELIQAHTDCHNGALSACDVQIGYGNYEISQNLNLCSMHIKGKGITRTKISSPLGVSPFRIPGHGECLANQTHIYGSTNELKDFAIWGKNTVNTSTLTYGIQLHGRYDVSNVYVRGYTVGVYVQANVHGGYASNANLSRMDFVRIDTTQHMGLFIQGGGDTNASYFELVHVTSPVCTNPSLFPGLSLTSPVDGSSVPCAAYVDNSFLTNTHVQPHTSGAGSAHPSYLFNNPNPGTVIISPYAEGGQAKGQCSTLNIVIGGQHFGFDGHCLVIGPGKKMNGMAFVNKLDTSNVTTVRLGDVTNVGGTFIEFDSKHYWPLRLKYQPSTYRYFFDVGNLGTSFTPFFKDGPTGADFTPLYEVVTE